MNIFLKTWYYFQQYFLPFSGSLDELVDEYKHAETMSEETVPEDECSDCNSLNF